MIYMLKVYMLVAVIVFGCAGAVILALKIWTEARQQYAMARHAMFRVIRANRS
jgi:hypothetical protein